MKNWSKKNISGGTTLILSLMAVNVINFIFNAFLGRVLSFEEFGLITLINTFLYIAIIPFNALFTTTNHKVAYLLGQSKTEKAQSFFTTTLRKTAFISFVVSCIWIATIPLIDIFFKINNYFVPLFFTPIITLGVITAVNKGFLQGKFYFHYIAVIITVEALCKLLFAWLFVSGKLNYLVYLSIPLSTFAAFLFAAYFTSQEFIGAKSTVDYKFPKKFFNASLLTGIASIAFLTCDVLLVKHFLSPEQAGQYSLLSLIGKMVFFFGSLPSSLIITFINQDEGKNRDTKKSFYTLFSATIIFSAGAFIGLGLFGGIFVPLLFGFKARTILPFLTTYAAAIMCYAIASSLVLYHLAKRQYIFPKISAVMAGIMALGIIVFHQGIAQITTVIFFTSLFTLTVLSTLHLLETYTRLGQTERLFMVHNE
ncbi:MAG TPA: hypothetical protein VLG12_06220 [Candidatus Saccharimonadales bacterium]|nr:hypothetical protein [Candidatus Saccharimonadales bacterium]